VAAVCRSYASHGEAVKAVQSALDSGVDGRDVLVLTAEGVGDVREEPVGSFAGQVEPDDPVGSFDDEQHERREGTGTFAGEPGRKGSFADAAHAEIETYPHGVERMHAIGHSSVVRLLQGTGVDERTAERHLEELHSGHVLVIVEQGG
jgi:hypothetical protein